MGFNFSIFEQGSQVGSPTGGITKYPSVVNLPLSAADGDVAIVLDTNVLYSYDTGVAAWVIIGGPGVAVTADNTDSITINDATNVWSADLNIGSTTLPANTQGISLLIQPTGSTGLYGYFPAGPVSEVTSSVLQFSGPGKAVGFSFGIQVNQASGSTPGYLSAADWTVFNAKVGISTIIQTEFPLLGGTNLPAIGGITFSIPVATGATGGYLSSSDWNTFNNKLSNVAGGITLAHLTGIDPQSFLGNPAGATAGVTTITVVAAKSLLGISSSNFGDVTLGAFLYAGSAFGATISAAQVLSQTWGDTTNPGLVGPTHQIWSGDKRTLGNFGANFLQLFGASLVSIGTTNVTTGYTWILPTAQGSTQTIFKNNGLGILSWGADGTIGGDFGTASASNFVATLQTRFVGVTTTTSDRSVSLDLLSGVTGAVVRVQKVDSGLGNVLVGATNGINGASVVIISGQWSKMDFISTGSGFYA